MLPVARSILIWLVAALIVVLVGLLCESASAATFTTRATVQITGPRGRCHAVNVPVRLTVDETGVTYAVTLPGPIAGKPWSAVTRRSWRSIAGELLDVTVRALKREAAP